MKRLLLLVVLLATALLMFVPPVGAQDAGVQTVPIQNTWSVNIGDNFFAPPNAAVEPGSTITWTNSGREPHTVTADDGSFDSGVLNPGDSYTVAFDGQGTVTYHCAIHPNMVGSVSVGGEAGAVPTEPQVVPATPEYSGSPGMMSMMNSSGY